MRNTTIKSVLAVAVAAAFVTTANAAPTYVEKSEYDNRVIVVNGQLDLLKGTAINLSLRFDCKFCPL